MITREKTTRKEDEGLISKKEKQRHDNKGKNYKKERRGLNIEERKTTVGGRRQYEFVIIL